MAESDSGLHITLETQSAPEDIAAVREGLFAYSRRFFADDSRQELNIFIRDTAGQVVGGLLGETFWGWLHVNILWLDESVRGLGNGTELLAMAEAEAIKRGCRFAYLDTLSFQARPFYEKRGYTLWGVLPDFPPGHTHYYLKKELSTENP